MIFSEIESFKPTMVSHKLDAGEILYPAATASNQLGYGNRSKFLWE
jgi:hypothetical protein